MRPESKPVMLGAVAVLSWSTVASAFKIALSHMSVYGMVFVASATALLIFTLRMNMTHSWGSLKGLPAKMWGRFALLGMITPVTYYLVLFKAYDYLPAQVAQPINYVWPILLAILLAVFDNKPIPMAKYVGMAVSLIGVAMISIGGKGVTGEVSAIGVGLAFCSALLWALYWIVNDSLKDKMDELPSLFLTFLFGMIYLMIGAIFMPLGSMDLMGLLSGAYIGAFEISIPFICFGMAIRMSTNPALINQMCYLSPFLSLFFISVIVGEPILPSTYLGLMFIVGGLIYNKYFAGKKISIPRPGRGR